MTSLSKPAPPVNGKPSYLGCHILNADLETPECLIGKKNPFSSGSALHHHE
jgi:hypothetical protein